MKRPFRLLAVLVILAVCAGSCKAVRKKNRCNTCPVWKDHVEMPR